MTDIQQECIITKEELEAARDRTMARVKEIAAEIYGSGGPRTHERDSFEVNVHALVELFTAYAESDTFSVKTLFDFINNIWTSPTPKWDGVIEKWGSEKTIRENLVSAQHLLDALGLKQQFMEYSRSLNNSAPNLP